MTTKTLNQSITRTICDDFAKHVSKCAVCYVGIEELNQRANSRCKLVRAGSNYVDPMMIAKIAYVRSHDNNPIYLVKLKGNDTGDMWLDDKRGHDFLVDLGLEPFTEKDLPKRRSMRD